MPWRSNPLLRLLKWCRNSITFVRQIIHLTKALIKLNFGLTQNEKTSSRVWMYLRKLGVVGGFLFLRKWMKTNLKPWYAFRCSVAAVCFTNLHNVEKLAGLQYFVRNACCYAHTESLLIKAESIQLIIVDLIHLITSLLSQRDGLFGLDHRANIALLVWEHRQLMTS